LVKCQEKDLLPECTLLFAGMYYHANHGLKQLQDQTDFFSDLACRGSLTRWLGEAFLFCKFVLDVIHVYVFTLPLWKNTTLLLVCMQFPKLVLVISQIGFGRTLPNMYL